MAKLVSMDLTNSNPCILQYTTTDGEILHFNDNAFGEKIISHTYTDKGIVIFEKPIVCIGRSTFRNKSTLLSITIPDSVTVIGYGAFEHCTGLTSVTIPDSVTGIGEHAFYNTPFYNNQPDGVVYLGKTLYEYKGIMPENTSLFIKEGTTFITSSAFKGCCGLKSITIPNSVTMIGAYAFKDCTSLTNINIPNAVTEICQQVFSGCSRLTYITIPNSITEIGDGAFDDCSALTSITIPDSVTEIGVGAFKRCGGELTINCNIPDSRDRFYSKFKDSEFTKIVIGKNVSKIGDWAFSGCKGSTSITIPNNITEIGYYAFDRCEGELTINCSIPDLHNYFDRILEGSRFYKIVIGNNVTKIEDYAFKDYSTLSYITIPDSITEIGKGAFEGCTDLWSVHISDLSAWLKIHFGSTDANPLYYAKKLYLNGNLIEGDLVIPDGITSIGCGVFRNCSGLTSVTIPDSVTEIGWSAFYGCTGLTSISIPNSVTVIGSGAFKGCTGLTNITIPDNVTKIGVGAFYGCTGLTEITIPDSATEFGKYAFALCKNLISVHISDLVAWCKIRYGSTDANPLFYANELYLNGKLIEGDLVIPDSLTSIARSAFMNCSGLTSVTIPDDVTIIGAGAFANCKNMKRVKIGKSVRSIGDKAFWGNNIDTIICRAENPPTLYEKYSESEDKYQYELTSFEKFDTLIVPIGCEEAYNESDWGRYIREETIIKGYRETNKYDDEDDCEYYSSSDDIDWGFEGYCALGGDPDNYRKGCGFDALMDDLGN